MRQAKSKSPAAPARAAAVGPVVRSRQLSPTEQRNPRSLHLDRMAASAAVELMLREEARVPRALLAQQKSLTRAVELVARTFRRGGRLFYIGAGTSGRLGVLDASECPPTFRVPPKMVQGIIAGGERALRHAVEGAEDDAPAGAREIRQRRIDRHDIVVGIAASGTTRFVWGALAEAKKRAATTMLLCFNPHLVIPRSLRPTLVLAPDLGPEVLTGSTRLKAGTATKLVLNLLTTLAMVRHGKVASNLMVDVNASNAKLRARAVRIVCELTDATPEVAEQALRKSDWVIRAACRRL
jgi:N-acetylmuramic acid 6-phosphate etherase